VPRQLRFVGIERRAGRRQRTGALERAFLQRNDNRRPTRSGQTQLGETIDQLVEDAGLEDGAR